MSATLEDFARTVGARPTRRIVLALDRADFHLSATDFHWWIAA